MVEQEKVVHPHGPKGHRGRDFRRVEPILVALIFIWLVVVFGALAFATIMATDHANQLLPTAIPTPKS